MQGGSYVFGADGALTRVEGTEPHPDGERARNKDGQALNGRNPVPPVAADTTEPAAVAAPTDGGRRGPTKKPE